MYCDLHTHSNYSDGTDTPSRIISEAKRLGLTAVALTDHNTLAGLPEFLSEAEKQGVTAIPGIEISTAHNDKEFHLLGLFVAPEHYEGIERTAEEFRRLKEESNIDMAERLNAAGYRIDYEVVIKRSRGTANRSHFADELLEKGYMSSKNEAFALLDESNGIYVPPLRWELTDAIRRLRAINAVPVLAHPLQKLSEAEFRAMLPDAVEAGLLGMETHHSSYDDEKIAVSEQIAVDFGLLPSGGSDYHGTGKKGIGLGVGAGNLRVPDRFYRDLLELHRSML